MPHHQHSYAANRKPPAVDVPSLFQQGNSLLSQGDYVGAAELYRQVLIAAPRSAEAHNNLGIALKGQHQLNAAGIAFQRAVALRETFVDAYVNLGDTLRLLNRWDDALMCLKAAIDIDPHCAAAHNNLGIVHRCRGDHAAAAAGFRRALELKPDYSAAAGNLANIYALLDRLDEAEQCYRLALRYNSQDCDAHNHLGLLLQRQGRLAEAETEFQQAVSVNGNYVHAWLNLGVLNLLQGRVSEAQDRFRLTLQIRPAYPKAHSNLLLALGYDPLVDAEELLSEHRRWYALQVAQIPNVSAYRVDLAPNRRLRVGYVSPDFRQHPVASFVEPILRHHLRRQFEVVCYSDAPVTDAMTERLQTCADEWHNVAGMTDLNLAERIVSDKIDVLVDLAGHTAGNRLAVFACRPAPVQLSMIGYGQTTGIPVIGYRITDENCDPSDEPSRYTEQLVRLKSGSFVFAPPEAAPNVQPPPVLKSRQITFGSFNNLVKINPQVIALWAQILKAVPDSRLLMKTTALQDAAVRDRYQSLFAEQGIAVNRLWFQGFLPEQSDHLAAYHNVDIALDPFPYTGATSTCEALWMGVPVVTLRGHNYVGRMSAGILTQAGLDHLIAESAEQYLATAVQLAQNLSRLSELRAGLRERLQASTICEAETIVRELEAAYLQVWQQWRRQHIEPPARAG